MEWAIETGAVKAHWVIREHKKYRYVAELHERAHDVTVLIKYGTTGFAIDYQSSENLLYASTDSGHAVIHKKYATWVKNLSASIQNQLASQTAPPPGYRSPPPDGALAPAPEAPPDAGAGTPPETTGPPPRGEAPGKRAGE
jgi:hypothetical protein